MHAPQAGHLAIGISGWTYSPWRGVFFPKNWPQKRELEYASRQVNSIEINGTFYSLQRPKSYRTWYEATPENFIFSVKAPRFITHIQRLSDVATPVANFFASGVLLLKEKLGPILWQLPPSLPYDREKVEQFLRLLPSDTQAAAKVARKCDAKMSGRTALQADAHRPVRHAMEVRHHSFQCEEFVSLLRAHHVALVVADTAGKWPFMEDVTSDFVYIRLHGDEELYTSGYTRAALREWARKIRSWAKGSVPTHTKLICPRNKAIHSVQRRDVFVYFDNDVKVRAPFDAMTLSHQLRVAGSPPKFPSQNTAEQTKRRLHWPPVEIRWR